MKTVEQTINRTGSEFLCIMSTVNSQISKVSRKNVEKLSYQLDHTWQQQRFYNHGYYRRDPVSVMGNSDSKVFNFSIPVGIEVELSTKTESKHSILSTTTHFNKNIRE